MTSALVIVRRFPCQRLPTSDRKKQKGKRDGEMHPGGRSDSGETQADSRRHVRTRPLFGCRHCIQCSLYQCEEAYDIKGAEDRQ